MSLLHADLAAQGPAWFDASAPLVGSSGAGFGAAIDPVRGRTVTFDRGLNSRTSEFDGLAWTVRSPAQSPPAGASSTTRLVFDPALGKTVLIGTTQTPTWAWDGTNWSQLAGPIPASAGFIGQGYHGGTNPGVICAMSGPGSVVQTWQLTANGWVLRATNGAGAFQWHYVPSTGRTYAFNAAWDGSTWTPTISNWPGGFGLADWCWDPDRQQFVALAYVPGPPVDATYTLFGTLVGPYQIQWTQVSNFVAATNTYAPPFHSGISAVLYNPMRRGVDVVLGGPNPMRYTLPASGAPWTPRPQVTTAPPPRTYADMTHDPALGRTILYGGQSALGATLGDTWSFDGTTWTDHGAGLGAAPLVLPALAPLAGTGTVMFGGATAVGGTYTAGTYVWNGFLWQQMLLFGQPPARYGHDMTSTSGNARVYLFGGYNGGYLNDTWRFGPTGWTQVAATNAPPPRSSHQFVYDGRRGRFVLFGGQGTGAAALGDTWELTIGLGTANWVQRTPAHAPSPRWGHMMAYDAARGVVVMTGGYGPPAGGGAATFRNDTWEFNGADWRQRTTEGQAPARQNGGFTYDPGLQRFVLQGGHAGSSYDTDTWYYNAVIDVPGTGMTSSTRALRARTAPVAGQPFTVEFDNPSTFGWVLVDPAPVPAGVSLPQLTFFCNPLILYGENYVIADAMGNPGRLTFQISGAQLGTAFTCQGISLTSSLCLEFTDPLLVTPQTP